MAAAVVCRFCGRTVEPIPKSMIPVTPSVTVPSHWSVDQLDYSDLAGQFPERVVEIETEDQRSPLRGLTRWELKNLIDYLNAGHDYSYALERTRPQRRL